MICSSGILEFLGDFLYLDMRKKFDYIVSSCLAGIATRYDGSSCKDKRVALLVKQGKAIPICPETMGGLSIPRASAQINRGEGKDVLDGRSRVTNQRGEDVTDSFLKGAYRCLEIARLFSIKKAIMKDRSPSCGCGQIYSDEGGMVKGDGVATSLLKKKMIKILCMTKHSNNLKQKTY